MTTSDARRGLSALSDRELIEEMQRLSARERHATADVIAALMELDERRLYLGEGYSSLFTYCTGVLHFSEHAAYARIEAARAARRFPVILDLLADGSLTLTSVNLLAAHLTAENHVNVLAVARHKSKREVEVMVATLRPLPDVPGTVRKLPAARAMTLPPPASYTAPPPLPNAVVHPAAAPAKPAVIAPLAPERYKLQITMSQQAHNLLRRAQDLLRHSIPNGDPAEIVKRGLMLLVDDLERKKTAAANRPRPSSGAADGSRHVPAAVKREVWRRDEGRCAFVGRSGRCAERGFLEFHHVIPFADGGATDAANLELRCRAHNAYEAEQWFGPPVVREISPGYEGTRSGPSCACRGVLRTRSLISEFGRR
jgi:hypothetical protein